MIKTIYDKWDELQQQIDKGSPNFITSYYVSKKCPANVYFGNSGGIKGIYLEFAPSVVSGYDCPSITGISIAVVDEEAISKDKKYLWIRQQEAPEEVFLAFINTLIDGLADVETAKDALIVMENTIIAYKQYFSNPNLGLSEGEEQGLCAELLFLKEMIKAHGELVILNWLGPNKNKRDFVFSDHSIEIKSTSGQVHPSITVSNENQLDPTYPTAMGKLYLRAYVLEKDELGVNVVGLASEIVASLETAAMQKAFLAKMLMDKVDIKIYKPRASFTVQSIQQYLVSSDFPSIKKNDLPKSVFDVKYHMDLQSLSSFINEDVL